MPYNEKYKGTIAGSLTPTFENVTRWFITSIIRSILVDSDIISFNFVFRQPEAIKFIEEVTKKYINELYFDEEYYKKMEELYEKIMQALKQENVKENDLPSLIINDYQLFFELLRQYYDKDIELFFERTKRTDFPLYEMKNCFENIWLRATPEDFNDPENFLHKQVQMINDTTFAKYDNEVVLGPLSYFDDHIICVNNAIARTWDEASREFKITIYDKTYHDKIELFDRPHYTLPVIRYGIYEKEGKKICLIGSIQNKKNETSKEVSTIFNKMRYKVNKGVLNQEYITNVEPSHLIALSIFVNFLHNEGITKIEVPSLYVLDYQYHEKRNVTFLNSFQREWSEYEQQQFPERYLEEKQLLEQKLNKEDLISQIKSERFIQTFMRLTYHYPKTEIISYAGEIDNYLHINIPVVQTMDDINGYLLQDLYTLVEELYSKKKNDMTR